VEPVSLVVSALVKLLLAGTQAVVERAMLDGYEALKSALVRKYGSRVEACIDQLEDAPSSPEAQRALDTELQAVGADRDPEIAGLTRQLMTLVEDGPPQASPVRPVVTVQRRAAMRAVGELMDGHLTEVMDARSQYEVEDADLLTDRVATADLPAPVKDQLGLLHERIRSVVEAIAQRIEDGEYQEVEQAIAQMRASLVEQQRAERLIAADKQLHVSYETLRLAVEFFGEFNQEVLCKIERERDADRLSTLMFGNAIMLYELTDFVIDYIERFVARGVDEVGQLHMDSLAHIADLRAEHDALERDARAPDVDPTVRDFTLADVANRRGALDQLESEWDAYVDEVHSFNGLVEEVRGKVPTLRLVRNNAKVQISTLQAVEQLFFLRQSSEAMRGTIAAVTSFRVAPLTSVQVRRLVRARVDRRPA
jgi:HPt (histidine-containing phosphotransfer) domain-containing protein